MDLPVKALLCFFAASVAFGQVFPPGGGGSSGGGSGTVTHGEGALTSNQVVTGNGTGDLQTLTNAPTTDTAGDFTVLSALISASFQTSGVTPGMELLIAGTGNIPALAGSGAGFAAPASGGTSYLLKLPATISAGVLTASAPATGDGVNESQVTITPISGAGNLLGQSSPTITTPIINNFSSSQHTHANAQGGGQLGPQAFATTGGTPSSTTFLRGDMQWATPANTGLSFITSGTSALGTAAIAAGACSSVVTTSATGANNTDVVSWGFQGDPTAVTGYSALQIKAYPAAGSVNFRVCNQTASSITPGALTLNWTVAGTPGSGFSGGFVQEAQGGSGGATTASATFSSQPGVGHQILVSCLEYGGYTIFTPTDNQGNTYTLASSVNAPAAADYHTGAGLWYTLAAASSGTFIVNCNYAATPNNASIIVEEWTGITAIDTSSSSGTGTANTTATCGAVTTTSATDLIIATLGTTGAPTYTPMTGYTIRGGGVSEAGSWEEGIVNSTGTYTPTFTMNSAQTYTCITAAFVI